MLSSFELSVSNIIGALLSGGIDQNVLLFVLNDDDSYENDALISKEVELSFSLTSGQSGQPIVLLTDVNGDSRQDLILSAGEERLSIFLGGIKVRNCLTERQVNTRYCYLKMAHYLSNMILIMMVKPTLLCVMAV